MSSILVIRKWVLRAISLGLLASLLVTGAFTTAVQAQGQYWIQLESQRNIRETRDRAQFFARLFPETRAFQTTSGWYAIVIGPMSADAANGLIPQLKAQNQIPDDSLVSDGNSYRAQLWPLAANTTTTTNAPEIEDTVEDLVEDTAPAEETPVVVAETTATDDAAAVDTAAAEETPVVEEPTGPIPDPDLRATKQLERAWSRDQKKEYQTYMVWTGDYKSAIDGSYGRGTRAAISAFQDREGYEATGYLTETQVELLTARYDETVALLGIERVRDLDAGIEIDMPARLVAFERFEPPFVHYGPIKDGTTRVSLISQEGGRAELAALYDIMETFDFVPAEGYRVRKRDWFVLSGRDDSIVSYTYAKTEKGLLKGFTLIWSPDNDAAMQPFATAMYNSFTPLEDYVLDETIGFDTGEDGPLDLTTGLETEEPLRAATGFFINASGVVVTNATNIEGCRRVTIADGVDMNLLARNPRMELAVLAPAEAYTPVSFALFSNEAPEIGAEITVSGFSFPDVMDIATLNYGTLTDTNGPLGKETILRVSAFLEAGDVGGPVLDDRGAVIGMQLTRGDAAKNLPEYVNFALKSAPMMELLDRHDLPFGRSTTFDSAAAEDIAFMAGDFTVKVSCWK